MDVATIMSAPALTATPSTTVGEALRHMHKLDIRHLPVLDGERLVGLVSERDLLAAEPDRAGLSLAEIMTTQLSVVTRDDDLAAVAEALVAGRMGCVPVLDGDLLVGIVSELDVLRAYASALRAGASELAPHVAELMTEGVYLAPPEASVEQALSLLLDMQIRHLPVARDGCVLGIVSDRDLRRAASADGCGGAATRLADCMHTDVVSVFPETKVHAAAGLMAEAKLSCLPVERDGELLGILTLTDLLEHASRILRAPDSWSTPR